MALVFAWYLIFTQKQKRNPSKISVFTRLNEMRPEKEYFTDLFLIPKHFNIDFLEVFRFTITCSLQFSRQELNTFANDVTISPKNSWKLKIITVKIYLFADLSHSKPEKRALSPAVSPITSPLTHVCMLLFWRAAFCFVFF